MTCQGQGARVELRASTAVLTSDSLDRYRCLGRLPPIVVVQTTQHWMRNNPTTGSQQLGRARNTLLDTLMRSGMVEVSLIGPHQPIQVPRAQDQEVVQTLPSQTPQKPLTDCIGPRSPVRSPQHFNHRPRAHSCERRLCWLLDSSIGSREVLQAAVICRSHFSGDGPGDSAQVRSEAWASAESLLVLPQSDCVCRSTSVTPPRLRWRGCLVRRYSYTVFGVKK